MRPPIYNYQISSDPGAYKLAQLEAAMDRAVPASRSDFIIQGSKLSLDIAMIGQRLPDWTKDKDQIPDKYFATSLAEFRGQK